jgi:hypothetical protein
MMNVDQAWFPSWTKNSGDFFVAESESLRMDDWTEMWNVFAV